VVEHPTVFTHFLDISGDAAQSLHDLYGGNVAAEHANEPLLVMHAHGPYQGVNGLFLTSSAELTHQRETAQLSTAAAKVGISSRVQVSNGTHVWQFAGPAFANAYPWLVSQLAPPHHRHT
jgi:S-formylglutathione hydrolase FrmB